MSATTMTKVTSMNTLLSRVLMAGSLVLAAAVQAAAPGITGPTFVLTAQSANLNQPDGNQVYSWGYGCLTAPAPTSFAPKLPNQACSTMQVPGPTLIVTEGDKVSVTLTNGLPTPAGNTSILFPDFAVTATSGVAGLLTQEAAPGSTVIYQFTATTPGTHAYYSGTQGDLQIEMGLYGAVIVLPKNVPAVCASGVHASNVVAQGAASLAHPGV